MTTIMNRVTPIIYRETDTYLDWYDRNCTTRLLAPICLSATKRWSFVAAFVDASKK